MIKDYTSFFANFTAVILLLCGHFLGNIHIYYAGLFALSGGVTNWLAVYMLFEKIPFLYGSGVIENNFEKLKIAIKEVILTQIISQDAIENASRNESLKDDIFDKIIEAILQTNLASLVEMMGGKTMLESLRSPFKEHFTVDSEKLYSIFETAMDEKMKSLSAKDIKKILENVIHKHLGWLVIWGAVFGGIIGLSWSIYSA